METEFFQDGGQIKREKDICQHGRKHIPIICQFPDPPSFSLPTTFQLKKNLVIQGLKGNLSSRHAESVFMRPSVTSSFFVS
jgi:hypothetical protein